MLGWVEGARAPRRAMAVGAALLGVATAGTGCGGGGTSTKQDTAQKASGKVASTLNIAYSAAPNSLDPALINQSFEWYATLAYDPVIAWDANGKPQPALASSWRYLGSDNTTFEITLRPGVKFSDGTPLDAQAVKATLDYNKKAGGQAQPFWTDKTISAVGPLKVRITSKKPDPLLPRELSQDYLAGNVINPKALAKPKALGTTTAGAGPYMLDPKATVANDHYTYVANAHYWNPKAVHYKRVVVKVITNPNAALNALKTGQVDAATGDYTTAEAAKSAGLQVKSAPLVWIGLGLFDRGGTKVKALGDVRVRKAINYAIDRKTITKALFGAYGQPTGQIVVPGQDGSVAEESYAYDPAKAKSLLAEAGYPGGVTIPTLSPTLGSQGQVVQAIAGDLAKVGIKLKVTTQANAAQYFTDMSSGKYPVAGFGFGGLPIYLEGPALFLPGAATFNPFKTEDKELAELYDRAASAPEDERASLDKQVQQRIIDQAWFAPVSLTPVFFFHRDTVTGVAPTSGQPITNPVWWQPT
ncbi:MAG: peptide/nickel transport system substrate-binding protein [Solirubrobacteraceae bacterium]